MQKKIKKLPIQTKEILPKQENITEQVIALKNKNQAILFLSGLQLVIPQIQDINLLVEAHNMLREAIEIVAYFMQKENEEK